MLYKRILSSLVLCLFVGNIHSQANRDTVPIRRSVDSMLALDQKIWNVLSKHPELLSSKLPVLRSYEPSVLLYQCYSLLANSYVRNGENELARAYLDTCYQVANKLKQEHYIAKTKYVEGIYLKFNGKSDQAMRNWFEAVETFRAERDEASEVTVLSAIAKEYSDLDQYDKAEKYLKEIIERKQKLNDQVGLSHSYNTIANVYANTKRFEEAISYFDKAIAISTSLADTSNLAYTYNNLARVYNKQDKLADAEQSWRKSYSLFMRTTNAFGIAMIINNMAYIHIKRQQYRKGIDFAKQAVEYSAEHDIQAELLRAHQNLMDAYYGLDDFKNGFKEYEIIVDMKDAQFNKNVADALAEAEQKYKAKVSQDSLVLLNTDKKLNTALLEKQQASIISYQVGLITIILLIIAIVALSYIALKNKNAREKFLQQEKLSQAVFETEQAERERIARDLHDSVGQKLSVVKMKLSMSGTDAVSTGDLLDQAIADVRTASHNLMPEDLKKGLITAIEEITDQINYTQKDTKVQLTAPDELRNQALPKQTELYLYRIIQEILSNALKYAQAKNIHINMDLEKEQLKLVLSDDGIGMNDVPGKTEGIGLKNIKARIEQLKGKLRITSKPQQGTTFAIDIPL